MTTRSEILRVSIAVALAFFALPSPAQSQSIEGPASLAYGDRTASLDRGLSSNVVPPTRLEQEARTLLERGSQEWGRAAARLVQAAELRPFGDDTAIANLRLASHLQYHLGNDRDALRLMENAADEAVAAGRIVTAANTYIDAAWIAAELGLVDAATTLVDRGILLTESPYLEEGARVALLSRVKVRATAAR